jgi:hypothetical protein
LFSAYLPDIAPGTTESDVSAAFSGMRFGSLGSLFCFVCLHRAVRSPKAHVQTCATLTSRLAAEKATTLLLCSSQALRVWRLRWRQAMCVAKHLFFVCVGLFRFAHIPVMRGNSFWGYSVADACRSPLRVFLCVPKLESRQVQAAGKRSMSHRSFPFQVRLLMFVLKAGINFLVGCRSRLIFFASSLVCSTVIDRPVPSAPLAVRSPEISLLPPLCPDLVPWLFETSELTALCRCASR